MNLFPSSLIFWFESLQYGKVHHTFFRSIRSFLKSELLFTTHFMSTFIQKINCSQLPNPITNGKNFIFPNRIKFITIRMKREIKVLLRTRDCSCKIVPQYFKLTKWENTKLKIAKISRFLDLILLIIFEGKQN